VWLLQKLSEVTLDTRSHSRARYMFVLLQLYYDQSTFGLQLCFPNYVANVFDISFAVLWLVLPLLGHGSGQSCPPNNVSKI
jgi:hypothetical protein